MAPTSSKSEMERGGGSRREMREGKTNYRRRTTKLSIVN
jgi:hypothetical protein